MQSGPPVLQAVEAANGRQVQLLPVAVFVQRAKGAVQGLDERVGDQVAPAVLRRRLGTRAPLAKGGLQTPTLSVAFIPFHFLSSALLSYPFLSSHLPSALFRLFPPPSSPFTSSRPLQSFYFLPFTAVVCGSGVRSVEAELI